MTRIAPHGSGVSAASLFVRIATAPNTYLIKEEKTLHRRRRLAICLSFSFDPPGNDLNTAHPMRATMLAILLHGIFSLPAFGAGKAEHIVVVVWDGMRPDFITEWDTPKRCQQTLGND